MTHLESGQPANDLLLLLILVVQLEMSTAEVHLAALHVGADDMGCGLQHITVDDDERGVPVRHERADLVVDAKYLRRRLGDTSNGLLAFEPEGNGNTRVIRQIANIRSATGIPGTFAGDRKPHASFVKLGGQFIQGVVGVVPVARQPVGSDQDDGDVMSLDRLDAVHRIGTTTENHWDFT